MFVCKYAEEQLHFPANTAFADSLRLFRHIYPGRKSYSLTSLFEDIERNPFNAHDALEDVRALSTIIKLDTHFGNLEKCFISTGSIVLKLKENENEKENIYTYEHAK